MARRRLFGLFPNVLAIPAADGKVVLAGRLLSGVDEYLKYWDGDVVLFCEPSPTEDASRDLDRLLGGDNVVVHPKDLPFRLEILRYGDPALPGLFKACDVAMSGVGHTMCHLSRLALDVGVPFLYGAEYTLKTRLQVVRAETTNPLRAARRALWEVNLERKQQAAIRLAKGMHCSGVPIFKVYKDLTPNPFLFFDGRLTTDGLPTAEHLARRHLYLRSGQPLRLFYSGRMNKMKGADHLILTARAIHRLGVPFEMRIFGGGVLADQMKEDIERYGLKNRVKMEGFVEFETLLPMIRDQADIFLCCHTQGDPSGAYMEYLGMGTPILGYDNEAFTGLLEYGNVGAAARVGDPDGLARLVANLHGNREQAVVWSTNAAAFGAKHTFDKNFERRIQHYLAVADGVTPTREIRGF